MTARKSLLVAAMLTLSASTLFAQQVGPFSLELRAGAGLPTRALGPRDLDPGVGFEVTAHMQVMPHLGLYAGWDWMHMTFKQDLGTYTDVEDTGYAFGARFFAPSFRIVTPWIRAGGVYDHVELESDDGDDYVSSDHVLGWEAGAGAAIALGDRWSLLPGARFRSFSPELTTLGGEADLNYFIVDVGISMTFGGRSVAAIRHR